MHRIVLALIVLISTSALAQSIVVLPEPLSFNQALNLATTSNYYSLLLAHSKLLQAKGDEDVVMSDNNLSIDLKGYVRKVGVSALGDPAKDNDSKISLYATKKLYDFGRSDSQLKAAQLASRIQNLAYQLEIENHRIRVVKAYLNVLKADNQFLMNNENMSIGYVRFNDANQNAEFGLSSDIEILQKQSYYELTRQQYFLSEAKQRFTRQHLAELLGAPNSPPDSLEVPSFNQKRRIIDDVDVIYSLALLNSLEIRLQNSKSTLAMHQVELASDSYNPSVSAEFEVSDYQRKSSFRDDWRASINFNVPLYKGNRQSSNLTKAHLKIQEANANLQKSKSDLRIKVLELWQTIAQKTIELEGAIIKQDYRDLYLEKSRADYELEYKSDLGDAMVEYSKSRSERYDIEFDLELAWRQLLNLVGSDNELKITKVTKL